jgi:FtsZ-binding cell division protein ZapB
VGKEAAMSNDPTNLQNSTAANGTSADLQVECDRLREVVKSLEQQRQHDQQAIEALRKERDEFRRIVYAWAHKQFTDEELQNIPALEDCLPLEAFIDKLERIVNEP